MRRWYRIAGLRQVGHLWTYCTLRGLIGIVSMFPRRVIGPVCIGLSGLVRILDRKHTRVARENLAIALPERSAAEREIIIRDLYRHFGLMMKDTILLHRTTGADFIARYLEHEDLSVLRSLQEEGKGLILITGHLGNWEVAGCVLGAQMPVNSVSREYRNPYINRAILRIRQAFGQKIIYPHEGLDPMLACLRRNESLAILPDKHLNASRIPVQFFGRWVKAPSGPALISLRSGAPVLPGGAFRVHGTTRFRIEFGEIIRPDPTAGFKAEIHRITQAYMTALEQFIRRYPEQWIWVHNRWKKAFTESELTFQPFHSALK